jgi:hypothetical protein
MRSILVDTTATSRSQCYRCEFAPRLPATYCFEVAEHTFLLLFSVCIHKEGPLVYHNFVTREACR